MTHKKLYTYLLASILAGGLYGCVPIEQQGQSSSGVAQVPLRYEDYTYNQSIKSVQLYAATGGQEEVLEPAVISISQERPVMLEFDRLNMGPQRLVAKLIHCNANWTPSGLNETQYLNDFNEFFITDVQNSVNTRVPFVHYRFRLPRVKLSGNYLVQVQEEGGGLLLTKRFMVYEKAVSVTAKLGAPVGPGGRESRQQVEFNIFYNDYPIVNPSQEVKVVMRQNHRWDNAKNYPRPTFVRDAQRRLEYVFFEPKENFKGLSEFRPFDTRSIRYRGIGVSNVNLEVNPVQVTLEQDQSRQSEVYSQDPDINGKQIFGNREYGNAIVNADYTWVDFELKSESEAPGSVYILGELTNWQLTEESRMKYNAESQTYNGRMLLKQGYYNYYYTLKPSGAGEADASYFEGSHFQTDNTYDILVYYRPPGTRADLLIGYEEFFFNRK
ncbi:type IX secretion system plug protein [Pontibacter arcticus]|uniref:DUF5103 domain-containing protein n=1 Tax=Pontibacter arcticus TaxID=2080288 RepID=A0A364RGN9_9BACT|nr:DUF5103 domain-containing protein [Pontibacter arcticus]RAU83471.1 DUF5103 domain-containing protein [Pontibacter arcticus]